MGGVICFGVRYERDGEIRETVMERWTNDLPWRILHSEFLIGTSELYSLVDETLEETEYWGSPRLVDKVFPSEYGCILVDLINKTCLSMNHYCSAFTDYVSPISSAHLESLKGLRPLVEKDMVICRPQFSMWDKNGKLMDLPLQKPAREISKEEQAEHDAELKRSILEDDPEDVSCIATIRPEFMEITLEGQDFDFKTVRRWLKENGWKTKATVQNQ